MSSFPPRFGALVSAAALLAPLFASAAPVVTRRPVAPELDRAGARDVLVRWGDAPAGLGFRPTATDFPGEGVPAAAVGPDGSVWLLDRLNGRVVRLGDDGALRDGFEIPPDAEDLAIGPDGTVALYSPLRARVWLFDREGPAGEMAVPRELEELVGFRLGASRQVKVHTSYQETLSLGSPAVPQLLPVALATKREGAFFLPDGAGLAVRRHDDGRAELLVLVRGERTIERARFPIGEGVLAARLVGVAGEIACIRLESELAGATFRVRRHVTCVDATTGRVVLEEPLPTRGPYLPRRELAVGGSPPRLVHLAPEPEGLRVRSRLLLPGGAR